MVRILLLLLLLLLLLGKVVGGMLCGGVSIHERRGARKWRRWGW